MQNSPICLRSGGLGALPGCVLAGSAKVKKSDAAGFAFVTRSDDVKQTFKQTNNLMTLQSNRNCCALDHADGAIVSMPLTTHKLIDRSVLFA